MAAVRAMAMERVVQTTCVRRAIQFSSVASRRVRLQSFSKFLMEVVTSELDFGESPVPVWTK